MTLAGAHVQFNLSPGANNILGTRRNINENEN